MKLLLPLGLVLTTAFLAAAADHATDQDPKPRPHAIGLG